MKSRDVLRELVKLSASQWGMVTSAQARARGVSRLDLARLTKSGGLIRLAHGVYRYAGAPSDEYESLRAAWLSTDPERLAEHRLGDDSDGVVVSGTSAAALHEIGDLLADRHEFTVATRRQSQRPGIKYRQKKLTSAEVSIVNGLPVTAVERTVADLVEAHTDLSLVADVLSDAARKNLVDPKRLSGLLAPLAARNGFHKDNGDELLERLLEIAGINLASLARKIASAGDFGVLVNSAYLGQLTNNLSVYRKTPEMERALHQLSDAYRTLAPQLEGIQAATKSTDLTFPSKHLLELVRLAQTVSQPKTDQSNEENKDD